MEKMRQLRVQVGDAAQAVVRRHRPDYQIVLYMGLLMLLGLIIMYAIGPQRANVLNNAYGTDYYTSTYFFVKQTISLLLALGAFILVALTPFEWMRRHSQKILLTGLAACVLLFLAGNILHINAIAQCTLGACRWFELGPLGSLQPAELLKFGILVFMAGFLGSRVQRGTVNDLHKTLIPLGVLAGVAVFFVIVLQKDMGTGISLLAIIAAMMMMVAGVNKKVGLALLGVAVILGILLIIMAPHRIERVMTFFGGSGNSSSSDTNGADYQITHAKMAIGSGGFLGVGIGNSVQATGYLPEAINDSVFAIMGETFGFVGLTVILIIFGALLMRLLKITDHLTNIWMKLAVAGVFGWLASHVILNVGAMIGVIPLTGITLPLLSFGGTSMIFIAGALGLAFQLSRYTIHGSVNKENDYENLGSRRGVGRSRNASSRGSTRA